MQSAEILGLPGCWSVILREDNGGFHIPVFLFIHFSVTFVVDFTSAGQQSWGSGTNLTPPPNGQSSGDGGSDRKKKRKSRWAQETEMEKTVIPGMPTVIPTGLSKEQEEQYLCKLCHVKMCWSVVLVLKSFQIANFTA